MSRELDGSSQLRVTMRILSARAASRSRMLAVAGSVRSIDVALNAASIPAVGPGSGPT